MSSVDASVDTKIVAEIVARARNWTKGADSYGDKNLIHRRPSAALRFGLEGVIAPGMWTVGHLQRVGDVSSISQINFSGEVYNGDVLIMENPSSSEWGENYSFTRVYKDARKDVCLAKGVKIGQYSDVPKAFSPEGVAHIYRSCITSKKLDIFLRSLGAENNESFPNMYIAALSAPALLELGGKTGLVGVHTTQTFDMHRPFVVGPVEVVLSRGRVIRDRLHYFNQHWVQDGQIKASGRAAVVPLDASKMSPPRFWRDLIMDTRYKLGV